MDSENDGSAEVVKHLLIKDIASELAGDSASTLLLFRWR